MMKRELHKGRDFYLIRCYPSAKYIDSTQWILVEGMKEWLNEWMNELGVMCFGSVHLVLLLLYIMFIINFKELNIYIML